MFEGQLLTEIVAVGVFKGGAGCDYSARVSGEMGDGLRRGGRGGRLFKGGGAYFSKPVPTVGVGQWVTSSHFVNILQNKRQHLVAADGACIE